MKFDLSNSMEQNKAKVYFEKQILKNSKIELKAIQGSRSISINSYLHVCITLFAIEFGYTLAEAKTILKRECEFMVYEKNGVKFLVETQFAFNLSLSM